MLRAGQGCFFLSYLFVSSLPEKIGATVFAALVSRLIWKEHDNVDSLPPQLRFSQVFNSKYMKLNSY